MFEEVNKVSHHTDRMCELILGSFPGPAQLFITCSMKSVLQVTKTMVGPG